jgi:hypothetical protein
MITIAAATTTTVHPGKVRNRVRWGLQIFLPLFFYSRLRLAQGARHDSRREHGGDA